MTRALHWRRSALALLAGAAAAPAVALVTKAPDAALRQILARAARHPDLAALGRAWSERHPERKAADWARELALGLPQGSEQEIVAVLRMRARDAFREGRIVSLDGWRVSRTEAQLCAAALPA